MRFNLRGVAFGAAVSLVSVGAAGIATSSASAATTIYGSGSSLQKVAQQNIFAPAFHALPAGDSVIYTSTSSGNGLDEFGNNTGAFDLTKDATANALSPAQLDDFVGTDDAPTATQLTSAKAATGSHANEITVPIAQAPVAILLSLPTSVTVPAGTNIVLSQAVLETVFHGGYASWDAFLTAAGVSHTGGTTDKFTLQARLGDSGTTRAVKGFLGQINSADGWSHEGSSSWTNVNSTNVPTITLNNGGGALVANTVAVPGSIGYANLADSTASITNVPQTVTTGGSHQIIRVQLKDALGNAQDASSAPASQTTAAGNLSTSGSGSWSGVPGTISSSTTWTATFASSTSVSGNYPLGAPTYDLGWDNYAAVTNGTGGAATYTAARRTTALSYFSYLLGSGQTAVNANGYNKLPASVLIKASSEKALVN